MKNKSIPMQQWALEQQIIRACILLRQAGRLATYKELGNLLKLEGDDKAQGKIINKAIRNIPSELSAFIVDSFKNGDGKIKVKNEKYLAHKNITASFGIPLQGKRYPAKYMGGLKSFTFDDIQNYLKLIVEKRAEEMDVAILAGEKTLYRKSYNKKNQNYLSWDIALVHFQNFKGTLSKVENFAKKKDPEKKFGRNEEDMRKDFSSYASPFNAVIKKEFAFFVGTPYEKAVIIGTGNEKITLGELISLIVIEKG